MARVGDLIMFVAALLESDHCDDWLVVAEFAEVTSWLEQLRSKS